MAKIEEGILDSWLKPDTIKEKNITEATILTEPLIEEGDYGKRYVCKIGVGDEKYKLSLNKTSLKSLTKNNSEFDMKDLEGVSIVFEVLPQMVDGKKKDIVYVKLKEQDEETV